MKLIKARVQKFRSIEDTGWFNFDELVTGLVGKNESGKTNILKALYRLYPIDENDSKFSIEEDYPRKEMSKYKKNIHNNSPQEVVIALFQLEEKEIDDIEESFGEKILKDNTLEISRKYNNILYYSLNIDESRYINHLIKKYKISNNKFKKAKNVSDLIESLKSISDKTDAQKQALQNLEELHENTETKALNKQIFDKIKGYIPKFVYFSDYDIMPGSVELNNLKRKKENKELSISEKSFLSFLSIADTTLEDLQESEFNTLNAGLESAQAQLTEEVFKFWSQNNNLKVQIKPHRINEDIELYIVIWNEKHQVSVSFDNRSRGFTWFFSFLAYFNNISNNQDNDSLVILLDEPGLALHGKAQDDLLKFIDEKLFEYQVIYSTHSPFMINPNKLERIRTVEDGFNKGTVVSSDLIRSTQDTGFPLRAALGIDLLQTLILSPNNLLVEGVSELIYIRVIGQACDKNIDPLWTITPVNGIDKMPAYISLFGASELNIVAVVDTNKQAQQKVKKLEYSKDNPTFLPKEKLIKVGDILKNSNSADIEDLFHPEDYLKLVNKAYERILRGSPLTESCLNEFSGERIVKKIESYFKKNFDEGLSHYQVANTLMKDAKFRSNFLENLNPQTKNNFQSLISEVNKFICQNEVPFNQNDKALNLSKNRENLLNAVDTTTKTN